MQTDIEYFNIISGANISPCSKYRYRLWRIWDDDKPKVLFVMHNPSIADGFNNDPTIIRCINFANSWGYGGIYVGNLFPYRATDPRKLLGKPFSEIAPLDNLNHINDMKRLCNLHILAYGNPIVKEFIPIVFDEIWYYLKLTKAGNPCHPLYLKQDLFPLPYTRL